MEQKFTLNLNWTNSNLLKQTTIKTNQFTVNTIAYHLKTATQIKQTDTPIQYKTKYQT